VSDASNGCRDRGVEVSQVWHGPRCVVTEVWPLQEVCHGRDGVTNSIGSLTTGLGAATSGVAELNNRHMGVTDSIGSLTMGLDAATSAIAELSLRVDAHMS